VVREAEVAEQTVCRLFPTKEQLVTDREQQIEDRLCDLIRSRPPGVTPAAATRDFVLRSVAGIRSIPAELWRGKLGYLAAVSPAVHRLVLELADRQAAVLAEAISGTTAVGRRSPGCRELRWAGCSRASHQRGRAAHRRGPEPGGDR